MSSQIERALREEARAYREGGPPEGFGTLGTAAANMLADAFERLADRLAGPGVEKRPPVADRSWVKGEKP